MLNFDPPVSEMESKQGSFFFRPIFHITLHPTFLPDFMEGNDGIKHKLTKSMRTVVSSLLPNFASISSEGKESTDEGGEADEMDR